MKLRENKDNRGKKRKMECQLYDQLSKRATAFALPKDRETQWRQICPIINRLPMQNREKIYILILHHRQLEVRTNFNLSKDKSTIPYEGKTFDTGKGVIYNPAKLPVRMQEIIIQYVKELVVSE
jgi:hypothetical protein